MAAVPGADHTVSLARDLLPSPHSSHCRRWLERSLGPASEGPAVASSCTARVSDSGQPPHLCPTVSPRKQ